MITDEGLKLIEHFEGCKLEAYQDTAGIWTIGYGHTKNVKQSDVCTQDQANAWLIEDLQDAEKRVENHVHVELKQCEKDSLISQAYNLRSFPKLADYLNKDRTLYLEKLVLYCRDVQGHELLGLKRRRYAERWLFTGILWNDILPRLEEIK
jgi:lysozyme